MKPKKEIAPGDDAVMFQGRRTRNFICLVDSYRRPSRRRSTYGVYRVGARDAKSAQKLLQSVISFGSIQVVRQDDTTEYSAIVPMGEVRKERYDPATGRFSQEPARHACAPRKQ